MSDIMVTGHRNPDTDSIVAAIAYANLRNSLGDREYRPVRIGAVNDETRRMLERFGIEAPEYVGNMRTQVCDIEFDTPPALSYSVPLEVAWSTMSDGSINTLPVVKEDGTIYSTLSAGDIANFDMKTIDDSRIDDLPLFNLLSVLEGQLVNEYANTVDSVSGEVFIALPLDFDSPESVGPDSIVICGSQGELVDRFIEKGVCCVIVCQSSTRPGWAEAEGTCIISTPLDPRKVARIIYQALPVSRACVSHDIVCFHLNDYLDDVKEIVLKSRYRAYPILDEKERVVGTLSRYHLLRPNRKRVVLVDHNESAQSVVGLEQVEILEIIDHHRLADIQTLQPISVRNEPVGSTNTIITAMYQERGVVPSPAMAGLMASAILSDTVMFKSPTCTKRDIAMAERLAKIAHLTLDDIAKDLFTSGRADDRSAKELFMADFKQFHISDHNVGVSQITCADGQGLLARSEEFFSVMTAMVQNHSDDLVILMITDVLQEGSSILYIGSDDVMQQAFSVQPKDNCFFLPGVMSRKKQIIPMLTTLWG